MLINWQKIIYITFKKIISDLLVKIITYLKFIFGNYLNTFSKFWLSCLHKSLPLSHWKDFFYHTSSQISAYLAEFNAPLEAFLRRYRYIGPYRDVPKRTHTLGGATSDVGISGERASDILLGSDDGLHIFYSISMQSLIP